MDLQSRWRVKLMAPFYVVGGNEDGDHHGGGDGRREKHPSANGKAYHGTDENAGGRGDAGHPVIALDYEPCADETNPGEDLGGNAPGVTVMKVRVGLADVDGNKHRKRGGKADESEGPESCRVFVNLSFNAYGSAKNQAYTHPDKCC